MALICVGRWLKCWLLPGLLLAGCTRAPSDKSTLAAAPTVAAAEPPDVPVPRSVEQPWMSLAEWRRLVSEQLTAQGREAAHIVFLGDSITAGWTASQSFQTLAQEYPTLNLGIGGDETQHLLFRISNGALDNLHPQLAVLMIGVNNLGRQHNPTETTRGVAAVVAELRTRLPSTRVLLLAILPAGRTQTAPERAPILETNRQLQALAAATKVDFLDLGEALLDAQQRLPERLSEDALHPTEQGYAELTQRLLPWVHRELTATP